MKISFNYETPVMVAGVWFSVVALLFSSKVSAENIYPMSCHAVTTPLANECGRLFQEVITPKFMAKYPAKSFELFVHAHTTNFKDGTKVIQVTTGVVRRGRNEFPGRRYNNAVILDPVRSHTPEYISASEIDAARRTIRVIMADLERGIDAYVEPGSY